MNLAPRRIHLCLLAWVNAGGKYQGSYSDKKLQEWADEIKRWKRKLTDIYVYFDNDQNAYAVYNALTLRDMLGVKPPPKKSEGSLFETTD